MSTAVLVMAYGTPGDLDDLEDYYTHIRGGRPPSPEALAELRERYLAIGGRSPLHDITRAQVDGIAARLDGIPVALGYKHAPPFVEDAVADLVAGGADRIVALVLAPHYSRLSVEGYLARARAAAGDGVEIEAIRSWATEADYVRLLAGRVGEGLRRLGPHPATEVLFTAHSLPMRILAEGDPYPDELAATASAVAGRLGLAHWGVAWQSAGRTPEPWIGPDVLDALDAARGRGAMSVLVCPCGFVSDHLEILYDLDVEAAERARDLGVSFARTRSPNDDPAFTAMLAALVGDRLRPPAAAAAVEVLR